MPVPSNHYLVSYFYYYFTLQLGTFVIFPVSHRNRRKMWVDYWGGGGGGKRYVAPLLTYWGPGPSGPLFLRLCLLNSTCMDRWMTCDFTSFSTVFQSYQDDARLIMKGCLQLNSVYCGEDFASSGDRDRSARSVGHRFTH